MVRFHVSPELSDAIKAVRVQNNIASKDLAAHIGKSAAFITKLEKCEIKTIKEEELTKILEFIIRDKDSFSEKLETLVDTMVLRATPDRLEQQSWLLNFDQIVCRIPLSNELAEDILYQMSSHGITAEELSAEICKNSELDEDIREDDSIPYNKWQEAISDGNAIYTYIKLKYSATEIEDVLHKVTDTNYTCVFAIVRFLRYLTNYSSGTPITDEIVTELSTYTTQYLNSYKFYSIAERKRLQHAAKTQAELSDRLSEVDKKNSELKSRFSRVMEVLSDMDVEKTNQDLDILLKNFQWDAAFTLRLLSFPFHELGDISFANKKQFIVKIASLLEEYKMLPTAQKSLECYD